MLSLKFGICISHETEKGLVMVVLTCNLSYLGGSEEDDCGLRLT
jgi:hypothetical protein